MNLYVEALFILLFNLICGKVHAVHLQTAARTSFFRKSTLAWLAYFFHIPVIIHLHSGHFVDFYENDCGRWKKVYIRKTLSRAYKIIVLTDKWKSIVGNIIGSEQQIMILPNPVIKPANIERSRNTNTVNLLFLGKICAEKGIYDLLNAVKTLVDEGQDIFLRCGGNDEVTKFNNEVLKLGIENKVEYLGWITGKEKDYEYANADIFILPSYFEGQPMTLLEAMASGLSIISTQVGGIPDTLENNHEALLVEAGSINELANAIRMLVLHPAMRHDLAKHAKIRFENEFDISKINEILDQLYSEL